MDKNNKLSVLVWTLHANLKAPNFPKNFKSWHIQAFCLVEWSRIYDSELSLNKLMKSGWRLMALSLSKEGCEEAIAYFTSKFLRQLDRTATYLSAPLSKGTIFSPCATELLDIKPEEIAKNPNCANTFLS